MNNIEVLIEASVLVESGTLEVMDRLSLITENLNSSIGERQAKWVVLQELLRTAQSTTNSARESAGGSENHSQLYRDLCSMVHRIQHIYQQEVNLIYKIKHQVIDVFCTQNYVPQAVGNGQGSVVRSHMAAPVDGRVTTHIESRNEASQQAPVPENTEANTASRSVRATAGGDAVNIPETVEARSSAESLQEVNNQSTGSSHQRDEALGHVEPLEGTASGQGRAAEGAVAGQDVPAEGAVAGPSVPAEGAVAGPSVPAEGAVAGPSFPAEGAVAGPSAPAEGAVAGQGVPAEGSVTGQGVPAGGAGALQGVPVGGAVVRRGVPTGGAPAVERNGAVSLYSQRRLAAASVEILGLPRKNRKRGCSENDKEDVAGPATKRRRNNWTPEENRLFIQLVYEYRHLGEAEMRRCISRRFRDRRTHEQCSNHLRIFRAKGLIPKGDDPGGSRGR